MNAKKTFWEFFRYLFAGGAAFVVDMGVLVVCRELLLKNVACGVYISVLMAFLAGHVTSYSLSMLLVFRDPEERRNGLTWSAFGLFAVVGTIGVGFTEFGMWVGYGIFHCNYILVKAVMAALVLFWNYAGRKMVVMQKMKTEESRR